MKTTRYLLAGLLCVAIMAVAIPQAAASAAPEAIVTKITKTVIITEAQINASHWITDPIRPSVSNKHVTLGNSTVTISATITRRDGKVFDASSVWKPYVTSRGVLVFGFQSASINAQTASSGDRNELSLAHQFIVRNAIRDYVRSQVGGTFQYKSILVTPGLVTITVDVYSK